VLENSLDFGPQPRRIIEVNMAKRSCKKRTRVKGYSYKRGSKTIRVKGYLRCKARKRR